MGEAERETKRDRVRRLFIWPLQGRGMRFPKVMAEADAVKRLNEICDEVGYLSDEGLCRLEAMMRVKGEGTQRDFWPSLTCIAGYAHCIEPLELGEIPALLRWFASAAGREALAAGRHVAEYHFWKKHRRPPRSDREKRAVMLTHTEDASRASRVRDQIRRGVEPRFDGRAWLAWYEAEDAKVRGYIDAVEDAA